MEIWKVISLSFLCVYGIRAKCKCNLKDLLKEAYLLKNNLTSLEKRELPEINEEASEPANKRTNEDDDSTEDVAVNSTKGYDKKPKNVSLLNYENHFEVNETEFQINSNIKDWCPYYKDVPELVVHKLANIWQVAYYKPARMNITCFRMYIEKVTVENRKAFSDYYSNFNGTIDWKKCYMEIVKVVRADSSEDFKRKHFLQGDVVNEKAVLDNIILTERVDNTTKIITLIEESPDQWMTHKNLLLMRDCELGTVVVFSKVPTYANLMDVEHALRMFGEEDTTEKVSCANAFDIKYSDRYNRSMRYKSIS